MARAVQPTVAGAAAGLLQQACEDCDTLDRAGDPGGRDEKPRPMGIKGRGQSGSQRLA